MQKLHNPHLGDLDDFILKNKGLVAQVARKSMYKTKLKVEMEDLMQEGYIGFIKAYCYYSPDKNTEFSTYAYYHIQNQIMKYIRDRVPMIRTPRNVYELSGVILREKMTNASPEEIAEKMGCTVKAANKALDNIKGQMVLSLNSVVADTKSRDAELMDILPQDQDFTNAEVEAFFDSLSDELKEVLDLAMKEKTQTEIGKELGFSQAQAWRLMKRIRKQAHAFFGEGIA